MQTNSRENEVRAVVENLIFNGCHYHLDELDRIYHADLMIVIVDSDGKTVTFDRQKNMEFFAHRRASGADPLDMSSEFNHVWVLGNEANVIVTRRMALRGRPEKIVYSIHLRFEDGRWQVWYETAFATPL